MGDGRLLGRAAESATIMNMIEALANGPQSLTIMGEAGIGKTALWAAALDGARASGDGLTIITARAVEAERDLAHVVLTDLLAPIAAAALPTLPRPQARALAAALLLDATPGGPPTSQTDPRALGTAVHGVLYKAAQERPVLIAIDDVQWVDSGSASVLGFALRRAAAAGSRIGLLLTRRVERDRPASPERDAAAVNLDGIDDRSGHILVVGPITMGVLHQLVRERIGVVLTRPQLVRLEQASAGNPMLALEIGRELARRDRWPLPGEPLPIPADTRDLIAARLERWPPSAIEVLFVMAALSAPTVSAIEATLARPPEVVMSIIDRAAAEDIIERDGTTRLRFAHPLIAAAVLSLVGPPRRRAIRARLAAVATTDEDRGRHLALATDGPDRRTAEMLDAAAVAARRRGAPAIAAAWSDLAADHTGTDTPDREARRRLLAARWWTESGDVARGRAGFERLIATQPAGDLRAESRASLAQIVGWDGGPEAMLPLALAALEEATEPELRARIRLRMAAAADHLGAAAAAALAEQSVRELRSMRDRTPDPDLLACALLQSATMRFAAGSADDEASVREAVALLADEPRPSAEGDPLAESLRAHDLIWEWAEYHDRFDEAAARGRREIDRARDYGLDRAFPIVGSQLALLFLLTGDWPAAAEHSQAALDAAEMGGNPEGRRAALSVHAALASARGELDVSDALVAEALPIAGTPGDWLGVRLRVVLGATALARGQAIRATAILGEVLDEQCALGLGETLVLRFAGDLVEAAVAAGDLDRAHTTVAVLEDSVRTRPRPWVRVMAARGRAQVAAADGDLDGAALAIAEAIEHGASLGMPFELARTELIAGRIERRRKQRRRAGEHLERAVAGFRSLGAAAWLAIAEAEAARLGRRAGGGDALTETELQVATLAARGLTNREVGEAAFLTPKSVEGVLARAYQKLGIRSRAELGAWLAGPSAGASAGNDNGIPPFRGSSERD